MAHLRYGRSGALLTSAGKLLTGKSPCGQIAVKTDSLQHPGCIDLNLGMRSFKSRNDPDGRFSKLYVVDTSPGGFDVKLRWNKSHSPYPKIEKMEIWVFGKYFPGRSYPKADDDYVTVCNVKIEKNGEIKIDGKPL